MYSFPLTGQLEPTKTENVQYRHSAEADRGNGRNRGAVPLARSAGNTDREYAAAEAAAAV